MIIPFSQCEEIIFKRKKWKCFISLEEIKQGESVFKFKFSDYNDRPIFYAKKEIFLNSDYWKSYKEKFLKKQYNLSDFKTTAIYYDKLQIQVTINDLVNPNKSILMDFEKAIPILINPPLCPKKYFYEKDSLSLDHEIDNKSFFNLVSVYLMCWYFEIMLKNFENYPTHFQILLSMSNDKRFQKKAGEILKMKDFWKILDIISKKEIDIKDYLFIIKTTLNRPDFTEKFKVFIELYQPHLVYSMPEYSYTRFSNCYNTRLVYIFINEPEKFPILKRLIDKWEFPYDSYWNFYEPFIKECYRACMIYYIKNKEFKKAIDIEEKMKNNYLYLNKAFVLKNKKIINYFMNLYQ